MPDMTPGIAQQYALWQKIQKIQKDIWDLQVEMIKNSDYLRAGAHTRLNKYTRAFDKLVSEFESAADEYDRTAAINLYFDGAASVGTKGFSIPTEDRIALQQLANLSQASHHQEIAMMRSEVRRFGNDIRKDKQGFKTEGVPTFNKTTRQYERPIAWRPDLQNWMNKHAMRGIRYADGRRMHLTTHEQMSMRSTRGQAYNLGRLAALQQNGTQYVEVFDGPGCGWTSHHDPEVANGKIVSIEDARAYPIAHPNCQRQFHPTKKTPPEKGSTTSKVAKALKIAAGVAAAAEATNLAVQAVQAAAASQTVARMQEELLRKGVETGDPRAFALERRLDLFRHNWSDHEAQDTEAMIFHLYENRQHGFSEVLNQSVLAATGTESPTGLAAMKFNAETFAGKAQGSIADLADRATAAADALPRPPRAITSLPSKISRAAHDAHLIGEAWTRGYLDYNQIPTKIRSYLAMTEGTINDRFSILSRMLKNQRVRETGSTEFRNLISYEQRIRKYKQLDIFSNTPLQSSAKFGWSQWGPRVRLDITEWLRGKATMTPTGMIKSLTVAPRQALKGTIRMFQDGNLGGSLSLVPKGMFRALVEVDDLGRVTGNVRLVPGGPIRLKLEFATPRPKGWEQMGLVPGIDFVDWRARQEAVKLAQGTFREKLAAFDVADAIKDLRQMELRRAVVDMRLFNTDIVKLSVQARIPLEDIKTAVREGLHLGQLQREAGGGITGLITIPFERGLEEFRQAWSLGEVSSTVFADISFAKPVFHGEVQNRVHFNSALMADVATSLKFRGYTVLDISNLLEVRAQTVQKLITDGLAQSRLFLNELGVKSLLEVQPAWANRVQTVMDAAPYRDPGMNRADVLSKTLDGFGAKQLSQGQNFSIRALAGINADDSAAVIELKLRSLVGFMRQSEVGSDELMAKLGDIDKPTIHALSRKLEAENLSATKRLRLLGSAPGDWNPAEGLIRYVRPDKEEARLATKVEGELTPTETADGRHFITHTKYDEANHGIRNWDILVGTDPDTGLENAFLQISEFQGDERPLIIRIDGEAFNSLTAAQQAKLTNSLMNVDPKSIDAALQQLDFMRQRFPYTYMPDVVMGYLRGYADTSSLSYEFESRAIHMWQGPHITDSPVLGKNAWEKSVILHDAFQADGNTTGYSYGRSTIIHETSHYLHDSMINSPEGSELLRDTLHGLGIDLPQDEAETFLHMSDWAPAPVVKKVQQELGSYATYDYWEMVAEAERHYLTDAHPGPIATAIGEMMDEFFNWRYGVNLSTRS